MTLTHFRLNRVLRVSTFELKLMTLNLNHKEDRMFYPSYTFAKLMTTRWLVHLNV